MAKVHYTTLIPDNTYISEEYPESMFADKQKASGFELHDSEGNYKNYVVVHGTGLTYKHGYLVGGTITGVEFKDGNDNDYLTVSQAHFKIQSKVDLTDINPLAFWLLPLSGNDKVVGSKQSDVLTGFDGKNTLIGLYGDDTLVAGGKDTMTGNLGSDTFVFTGEHKVVITDFDAVGGGQDQDYVYFVTPDGSKPRIYQDHHNTVLDFGHGHTATLLNVDRLDFSLDDDFKAPPVFAADQV